MPLPTMVPLGGQMVPVGREGAPGGNDQAAGGAQAARAASAALWPSGFPIAGQGLVMPMQQQQQQP